MAVAPGCLPPRYEIVPEEKNTLAELDQAGTNYLIPLAMQAIDYSNRQDKEEIKDSLQKSASSFTAKREDDQIFKYIGSEANDPLMQYAGGFYDPISDTIAFNSEKVGIEPYGQHDLELPRLRYSFCTHETMHKDLGEHPDKVLDLYNFAATSEQEVTDKQFAQAALLFEDRVLFSQYYLNGFETSLQKFLDNIAKLDTERINYDQQGVQGVDQAVLEKLSNSILLEPKEVWAQAVIAGMAEEEGSYYIYQQLGIIPYLNEIYNLSPLYEEIALPFQSDYYQLKSEINTERTAEFKFHLPKNPR